MVGANAGRSMSWGKKKLEEKRKKAGREKKGKEGKKERKKNTLALPCFCTNCGFGVLT